MNSIKLDITKEITEPFYVSEINFSGRIMRVGSAGVKSIKVTYHASDKHNRNQVTKYEWFPENAPNGHVSLPYCGSYCGGSVTYKVV